MEISKEIDIVLNYDIQSCIEDTIPENILKKLLRKIKKLFS